MMIDIENRAHQPSMEELTEYVGNPLFDELLGRLNGEYQPACSIEYSGDRVLLGWNVKLQKAGKTLCTLYPRKGYFGMLLVVGQKEKPRVEALLPTFSEAFRQLYQGTREGMGQRWLVFDLAASCALLSDAEQVIRIRRQSK